MTESYFVECSCGASMPVELWKAGSTVPCPRCKEAIKVPNSIQLKQQSGDKYPHLSLLQKVKRTAKNREDPFQGHCHKCLQSGADFQIPVLIRDLKERAINEPEHSVIPIITPISIGVHLRKGEITDETWEVALVSVLLCSHCHDDYQRAEWWLGIRKYGSYVGTLGVLVGLPLWFRTSLIDPILLVALSTIPAVIVFYILSPRPNRHPIFEILQSIRWLGECLRTSMDCRIGFGKSEPYTPNASSR